MAEMMETLKSFEDDLGVEAQSSYPHSVPPKVGIATSSLLCQLSDLVPANKDRQSTVVKLIEAYELHKICDPITVQPIEKSALYRFHSRDFVDFLMRSRKQVDREVTLKKSVVQKPVAAARNADEDIFKAVERFGGVDSRSCVISDGETESSDSENDVDDVFDEDDEQSFAEDFDENVNLQRYGLLYDCPIFPHMKKYVAYLAGSAISTANYIIEYHGIQQAVGINWFGGRHHASKSKSSGFCYINDIVLAIIRLRQKFSNILYIDLDLHHGDGVEAAFKYSNNVTTFSIHRYDLGFFPGTGGLNNDKISLDNVYNIPMLKGMDDNFLSRIIEEILLPIIGKIQPDCLVIQCGCDGLANDEHKEWNLTIKGFGDTISKLIKLGLPMMVTGGGGYSNGDVAKCWTYLTSIIINQGNNDSALLWDLIPEHEYLDVYEKDSFEFWKNCEARKMKNENDDNFLCMLKDRFGI